jgi:hypothetical protein
VATVICGEACYLAARLRPTPEGQRVEAAARDLATRVHATLAHCTGCARRRAALHEATERVHAQAVRIVTGAGRMVDDAPHDVDDEPAP